MMMRSALFVMLMILLMAGCGDSGDPRVTAPVTTVEHPFYFDVTFLDNVGNFRMWGTFIDSHGRIVAYDHSHEPWQIASPFGVTAAELADRYSVPTDTLGVIDAASLGMMYGKVDAASRGTMSALTYTGDGPGSTSYGCHVYDDETGLYVKVPFRQDGDFSQANTSLEAQELVTWLDSVLP